MATINNPRAGVSPYYTAAAAEPTVLATTTNGRPSTVVAPTSVTVNGQAALNSLITTSQTGVFQGANVTINLEEQLFNTTNQVTSTTNYPSGNTGEIQYNSGNNSFASDAYFTYTNSNVVTPGIRTNGYFYGNGAPFIGGGNAAIGNFVFSGDTMTISDDANISLTIQGNSLGNNLNQIIINPTSVDIYAFNNSPYSYSELYLDNGNTEAPYAQIIVDGNSTPQQTWTFAAAGTTQFPGNVLRPPAGNPLDIQVTVGNAYSTVSLYDVGSQLIIQDNTTGPNPAWALFEADLANVNTPQAVVILKPGDTGDEVRWYFDALGNLTLPGNTSSINYANNQSILSPLGTFNASSQDSNIGSFYTWHNQGSGNNTYISSGNTSGNVGILSNKQTFITTEWGSGNPTWTFDENGNLTLPSNTSSINYANGNPYGGSGSAGAAGNAGDIQINVAGNIGADSTLRYVDNSGEMTLYADYLNAPGIFTSDIYAGDGSPSNLTITTNYGNATWTFKSDGNLSLPTAGNIVGAVNIIGNGTGNVNVIANNRAWTFAADGNLVLPLAGNIVNYGNTWNFGLDGNLTLPANIIAINYANGNRVTGNITFRDEIVIGTGTSNLISGLYLAPSSSSADANMYLRVRGNITDEPTHIHFDTGNNAYYNQFIGDDNKYIQLANTGNIVINSNNGAGNSAQWNFGSDGNLTLPGNSRVAPVGANIEIQAAAGGYAEIVTSDGNSYVAVTTSGAEIVTSGVYTWAFNNVGTLTTPGVSGNITGANVISANVFTAPGNVTITANISNWTFNTDGNLTLPNGAVIKDTAGNSVAFGKTAGNTGQGISSVAIGYGAGLTNQGNQSVAIGENAGSNQGSTAVAIGQNAGGSVALQGDDAVAIGHSAGANTQGTQSVAIGLYAGETTQGIQSVAIGSGAGYDTQGANSVAIGSSAGNATQGIDAVAVGVSAGGNVQGNAAVAVGPGAGYDTQGIYSVAVGPGAGQTSQGSYSVAIGVNAGNDTQGANSIAIGGVAGQSAQGNNSIILNATGVAVNQTTANTFTVAPVRNDVANIAEIVFYNTTSKEITYGNTISVSGNITGAYFSGNGSGLTGVGAASVPSQTILPTIQTITVAATSGVGNAGGGGSAFANVTVSNVTPVTEYGVIITSGTSSQKYATGALGSIPGTVKLSFTTGLNSTPFTVYAYVTSNAGTYYSNAATGTSGICLLAGTQIALSDGTHKAIEDITYTDKLLSWDFDRGCYAETTAMWIKRSETGSQYNLLTFSDGTTLRTFDQHRIFNKQAGAFTYPMTDATPIGTVTVNEHGQEITLTNKQVIQDTIEYYNVITDYHMNLFSDSVLTSCRFNNIYPITDMKFVKDGRTLRTRSEFENVEDRFFHGLRLAEQIADIETVEWYVNRLLSTEVSTQSELAF